jgi:hypothetical protein
VVHLDAWTLCLSPACTHHVIALLRVLQAHQKYNSVMRKLEALRESADTAAAQGDARLASILHRQLWFEAACNYVLLRTWQRVVSALESDLNTLRGLAADYVTKTTAGAGHTLAGAGQPPRMAGGRAVRVA